MEKMIYTELLQSRPSENPPIMESKDFIVRAATPDDIVHTTAVVDWIGQAGSEKMIAKAPDQIGEYFAHGESVLTFRGDRPVGHTAFTLKHHLNDETVVEIGALCVDPEYGKGAGTITVEAALRLAGIKYPGLRIIAMANQDSLRLFTEKVGGTIIPCDQISKNVYNFCVKCPRGFASQDAPPCRHTPVELTHAVQRYKDSLPQYSSPQLDKILLAVSVYESQESFVNLTDLVNSNIPLILQNGSGEAMDHPTHFLRQSVASALAKAAVETYDNDHMLVVESAYRSLHTQQQKFKRRVEQMKEQYPHASDEELFAYANQYTAGIPLLAAHTAGAAVDVFLADLDGNFVDMGCDTMHAGIEASIGYKGFQRSVLKRRDLLTQVMGDAGFTNYPFEWWHWSIGDVCDAYIKGKESAIYSPADYNPATNQFYPCPQDQVRDFFNK